MRKDNFVMEKTEIKAVLLDVDNTLLDFDESSRVSMYAAAEQLGIALPEGFYQVFKRINDSLWKRVENGGLERAELYKIRWNMIFEEVGIDFDGERFERAFDMCIRESAEPVAGAEELLEYLYGKYPLYIASNASYIQQRMRLKKSGMFEFIEEIFASESIGASKPSEEFFTYCREKLLPTLPEETMIIGDSYYADIVGGHRAGFKTFWYNHGHAKEPENSIADFTTDRLIDIKKIL